ncbi:helix-turn-helix domain-containing protein [Eubacteriales bacterium KG125]
MKDEIKEIRKLTGLSHKFAKKYEISLSTLESWERGTREPASHVINLLEFKVKKIYKESKQGGSLGSLFYRNKL